MRMFGNMTSLLLHSVCFAPETGAGSGFDPEAFMSTTVDNPMSTEFAVCPPGEYQFMVDDFGPDIFETKDRKDGEGTFTTYRVPCVCQDEGVKAQLKRDKVTVPLKGFLDFDASGAISTEEGKNVKLGQLRKALGQNSGQWSFSMLKGQGPFIGKVGFDKTDTEKQYPTIVRVSPIRR